MRIISKLSDETQIPAANFSKILYCIGFHSNKSKKFKNQAPQGFIYNRNFRVEIRVQTGSSKNVRVLIGLAPKGKQML
jgi:hypothetical protein